MRAPSEFPTGTRLISFERICFSWDKQPSRGPTWCRLDAGRIQRRIKAEGEIKEGGRLKIRIEPPGGTGWNH